MQSHTKTMDTLFVIGVVSAAIDPVNEGTISEVEIAVYLNNENQYLANYNHSHLCLLSPLMFYAVLKKISRIQRWPHYGDSWYKTSPCTVREEASSVH